MFGRKLNLCAAVHSNRCKPKPKIDVTGGKFEFEFPGDLHTLKGKEGER